MKIPISGYGCVCALGADLGEIKKNLFDAPAAAPTLPLNRLEGPCSKSYPVFQAPQKVLGEKRPGESYGFLFARTAINEALKNAGLSSEDLQDTRVAIIAGTSVDASFNCFDFYKTWRGGMGIAQNVTNAPLLNYLNTPLSGALQKYYGFKGPQITITTACASGTDAIGLAAQYIEQDLCDVAIALATDELNLIPYTGFIRLMIASQQPCAPFSKGRTGINLGEGAGAVIMESERFLNIRCGRPHGFMLGYGSCCDAYHATAPDPRGHGLKTAINAALGNAKINPADLAFINAHGTGTADNDAVEAKVFNELLPRVPVMASKSHTGHTLGAAGAVEAVLALLCLNEGIIAKTRCFNGPDPDLKLTPVLQNTPLKQQGKIALSNSLAFGGCNSAIVLAAGGYGNE